VNPYFSPSPGVPIRADAVKQVVATCFAVPCSFSCSLDVSVLSTDSIIASKGTLESVTPDELRHAYILAISRDITAKKDDSVLRSWRNHVLSTTMSVLFHNDIDERYWVALQARENIGATSEAVCRTCIQRIYEVIRFRDIRIHTTGHSSAGSAQAVADAYKQLRMAGKDVLMPKTFIDTALAIHERMLRRPRVADILLQADAGPKEANPFDGVYGLQAILSKAGTEPRIYWVCASILQLVKYNIKAPRFFTVNTLRGTDLGNRGYVDVLLYKLETLSHLFEQLPKELGLPVDWIENVARKKIETHDAFAKFGRAPSGLPAADTNWMVGQKKSVLDYVVFVSDCVMQIVFATT
jgi:hypothetical protein